MAVHSTSLFSALAITMKNREPHSLSSTLQLARGLAMALAVAASAGGVAAQTYINATVGGQIAPGVYGRVDIGNSAPALLYPQPVVIAPPAVYVPRSLIYMYVPPGHAKNWSKHCARYSACGQPVYFVKEPPRRPGKFRDDRDRFDGRSFDDGRGHWNGRDRDDDHRGRGNGKGNGNGRGHGRGDR